MIQRTYALTPYVIDDENIDNLAENIYSLIYLFNEENRSNYDRIAINLRFTLEDDFISININKDVDLVQLERVLRNNYNNYIKEYNSRHISLHSLRFFI